MNGENGRFLEGRCIQNGDAADKRYQTNTGRFRFQNLGNTYHVLTVNSIF